MALVCTTGGGRIDARTLGARPSLSVAEVSRQLEPLLHIHGERRASNASKICAWIEQRLGPRVDRLLAWSKAERDFLDRLLDKGQIEPELLTTDPLLQERVRMQPMLQWKARHASKHGREQI